MSENQVTGFILTHYEADERKMIIELFFSADKEHQQSLTEMLRFSLISANKKYPSDTTLVLPCEEEQQISFVNKLFGE